MAAPEDFAAVSAELRPCRHMRHWVSALADGSLTGLARWYTNLHVAVCPRCRAALEALRALRERLRALGRGAARPPALSDDRATAIADALDAVDRRIS